MPKLSVEQEHLISSILARTRIRAKFARVSSPSIESVMHPNIIEIMTPDEVRSLCAIPGFVSMGTIGEIAQKLQVSEAQALIIPMVKSWQDLQNLLSALPINCWNTILIGPLRNHIESFVDSSNTVYQITIGLYSPQQPEFLTYLGMTFLSNRIDNRDKLYWVLGLLPEDKASDLILALGPNIEGMITVGADLFKIYHRINTSQEAWVKNLDEAYLKSTIHNANDLICILRMIPAPAQFPLMESLGPDAQHAIFSQLFYRNPKLDGGVRIVSFLKFLAHMPDGLRTVPAHALIATIHASYFQDCALYNGNLEYMLKNSEPKYSIAVLDVIGRKIINAVEPNDDIIKMSKPLSRIYTFYRQDHYCRHDDSIENLMSQVNVPAYTLNGQYIGPANTIPQSIIDECKKKPGNESLLAFLNDKLDEIDRSEEPSYQYRRKTHLHNGELAMRIMYCRMRLIQALHTAPVSEPKLNTGADLRIYSKDIIMPKLSIEQENLISGILARAPIRVESGKDSSLSIEDVTHPSIIAIMTPDEVRSLCTIPGFVSMGTMGEIAQKLQVSEAQALIIPMVKSWQDLKALLSTLPINCWNTILIGPLRKHIESFIVNENTVKQITSGLFKPRQTAFLEYLRMGILINKIDNREDLDRVVDRLSEDAASDLILSLGRKIREMTGDSLYLHEIYTRIKTSKEEWVKNLGETYLKSTIDNAHDLICILDILPEPDQFSLMKSLGPDALRAILNKPYSRDPDLNKDEKISTLTQLLKYMPNGLRTVPAHALIGTLHPADIKLWSRLNNGFSFLVHRTSGSVYLAALLDVIGKDVVGMIHHEDVLVTFCNPLSRLHKFYRDGYDERYHASFTFDNLPDSIEKLMSEINTPASSLNGNYSDPANTIPQSIIDECKKKPNNESLLAFLNEKLEDIDSYKKSAYQYKQLTHQHDGELAMRIMYCRMRLLQALHPTVAPVQKVVNHNSTAMTM